MSLLLRGCAAFLCFAPLATAQVVEPLLQKKIQLNQGQGRLPIVLVLNEQLDVASLDARLERAHATRAQRHQIVVESAQEVAQRTQAPLLAKLRELETRGHVTPAQPYWVMNAVGTHATVEAILTLAAFPGVRSVLDGHPPIELIAPVGPMQPTGPVGPAAVEPGLTDIRADFLWNLGYTGTGRIVCNLDTGVEGTHPAYNTRWRGNRAGVLAAHAWHSPTLRAPAPRDGNGHGTHTMGTMCGDDGTNRVGVAPTADWIASDSIAGSNLTQIRLDAIAGFQWCADPDANPATVVDVPDVSSNSWGFSPFFHGVAACDQSFWQAIDVAEAAGVCVVFAAGNEGSRGAGSLRTPCDRETPTASSFSVGALNVGSATIASFSSLGPSGCAGSPIKPEVCAQGNSVRSAIRGGGYGLNSGTSMACPHVAGAATLLRQVDPNLSSAQVKSLLFDSANDLGAVGEDNTYGKGRINLQNAYNLLRARQGVVSVGVVTPTGRVQRGRDLRWSISFTNNTNQPQNIILVNELEAVGQGITVPLVGPFQLTLPPNFTLEPNWDSLRIALPATLDAYYTTFPFRLRMRAIDPNTLTTISLAETDFVITL
jgi:subtilisin family serine protease